MKFLPHTTGTNRLTAMYEMVMTHIEQYVQKTYKHGQDIAESLRELEKRTLQWNANEKNVCADSRIREEDREDLTRWV